MTLTFVLEFKSNTTRSVAPCSTTSPKPVDLPESDVCAYLKGNKNKPPVASEYDFRTANPWTHPRADVYRFGRASGMVDAVVRARLHGDKFARFKKGVGGVEDPDVTVTGSHAGSHASQNPEDVAGRGTNERAEDVTESGTEECTAEPPCHEPLSVLALLSRQSERLLHSAVVCYFVARDEAALKREIACRGPLFCVLSLGGDFTVFWNKLINDTSPPSPVFVPALREAREARDDASTTSVTACILGWTAAAEWIIGTSLGATMQGLGNWGHNGCFRVPFVASWWLSPCDHVDHAIVGCLPVPTFEGAFDHWSSGGRDHDGDGDAVLVRVASPLAPAVVAKLRRRSDKRLARRARRELAACSPSRGADDPTADNPTADDPTAAARPATRLTLGHGKNKGTRSRQFGGAGPRHAEVLKERLRALLTDRFQLYTHAEWRDVVVLVAMTLLIVFVLALSCSRRGRRFLFA